MADDTEQSRKCNWRKLTSSAWVLLASIVLLGSCIESLYAADGEEDGQQEAAKDPDDSPFPLTMYDTGQDIRTRDTLTGNWSIRGSTRNELAESGITPKLQLTQILQAVTQGGATSDEGLRYSGSADAYLDLDTTRLGLWSGGLWHFHAETWWGHSANPDAGSLMPVNHDALFPVPEESGKTTLSELSLTQYFSPRAGVLIGKIDPVAIADANVFANNERTQFLNTALRNNPVLFPQAPYTTLAVAAFWQATESLFISAFALDGNGTATRSGLGSNGWFHRPKGTNVGSELTLTVRPFGLSGHQRLGIAHSNKEFTNLTLDPRFDSSGVPGFATSSGDWIMWYNFDQYLYTDPQDENQGFGIFGRFGASNGKVNPTERFYSIGIGGQSFFPGRDLDRFGVGYYYFDISEDLSNAVGVDHDEQGAEVFYNAALTPWITFSLDVQYIIHPAGGFEGRRNAVVVGTRIQMEF
ncbi:MAG: carbohydrate porin [Chloroflexi bacterium]|nr:MAG: carbohydrate porin [Chloroflexota bacterium]